MTKKNGKSAAGEFLSWKLFDEQYHPILSTTDFFEERRALYHVGVGKIRNRFFQGASRMQKLAIPNLPLRLPPKMYHYSTKVEVQYFARYSFPIQLRRGAYRHKNVRVRYSRNRTECL
jgi:hypothetical protein